MNDNTGNFDSRGRILTFDTRTESYSRLENLRQVSYDEDVSNKRTYLCQTYRDRGNNE